MGNSAPTAREASKAVSETSPLLPSDNETYVSNSTSISDGIEDDNAFEESEPEFSRNSRIATICVLMIGVFIANVDTSLVLATNSAIASPFSQLHSASWLTASYVMANCAAQPVVGKLSDIFGRKSVLLRCYGLFAIGCGISGGGQAMWHVIAGRSIAGLGGAGMTVIVSVLITDLVPKIEVASWRSYVNIAATTGRMAGGPMGGWLADIVGWRWSFLGQVPLTVFAALLVAWKFKESVAIFDVDGQGGEEKLLSKFKRIDFLGAGLLSTAIVSFLFAVDLLGEHGPGTKITLAAVSSIFLVLIIAFFVVEAKNTKEPIFPIKLLVRRDVATAYLITILQTSAQLAVMFSVRLYFQVIQEASNTAAGARLMPAFIGNTIGALLAGIYIQKTGRYKKLTILALLIACTGYMVMILRWSGEIYDWEAFEIFPGGFGSGMASSSIFIALTSNMGHENIAVATSGMYLCLSLGSVLGISISSSIQRGALKVLLERRISAQDGKEIIEHVLVDVKYLRTLRGSLKDIVIGSYVESLGYSHGFSLICSLTGLIIVLLIHEHPLK